MAVCNKMLKSLISNQLGILHHLFFTIILSEKCFLAHLTAKCQRLPFLTQEVKTWRRNEIQLQNSCLLRGSKLLLGVPGL